MEQQKKMYYNCSVDGCFNSTLNCNFSFFKLPVVSERRSDWLKLINREDLIDSSCLRARVCEAHFSPKSIIKNPNRKLLKRDSIPHLLLPLPNFANKGIQAIIETADANVQCDYDFQTNAQTDQPQTIPVPNPSPSEESEANDDDSIYEREVSPIRTEDDSEATVTGGSSCRHEGYHCDGCRAHIVGFRYACVECPNFDLCSACEARAHHAQHYMLRVPASKLHSDVRAVIQKIREQLVKDDNIEEEEDDTIGENSIKIEIKEEDLKEEDPLEQTAGPSGEPLHGAGGQDIQYEESEDSTTVKILGLSEGAGLPVFEVPLSRQPAVSRVQSHSPKIMPQIFSHGPEVLSHQPQVQSNHPALPQVLYYQPVMMSHEPQVLTHQPAVLSNQPKDQSEVQSKRKVLSHQPAVPQVISHQPAAPQVLLHGSQIPHATSHEKRSLMLEVQGVDTVCVLAGALEATGAAVGVDYSRGKVAGEEESYAVYTHHADSSRSPQDQGAQPEEPTSSGDEKKPSRKKRKK